MSTSGGYTNSINIKHRNGFCTSRFGGHPFFSEAFGLLQVLRSETLRLQTGLAKKHAWLCHLTNSLMLEQLLAGKKLWILQLRLIFCSTQLESALWDLRHLHGFLCHMSPWKMHMLCMDNGVNLPVGISIFSPDAGALVHFRAAIPSWKSTGETRVFLRLRRHCPSPPSGEHESLGSP